MPITKWVDYEKSKLSYFVVGTGPAVVLIHGFGEDAMIWKEQLGALQSCKLIIPDLPGSGNSPMIDDMSIESLARCINIIIEEENEESAILIGHSMGGYITLSFIEQFSNKVIGFGLFHSTAYADNEEKKATRKKAIEFINEHGGFAFLKTSIPDLYSEETKKSNQKLVEQHIHEAKRFDSAALIAYYKSMMKRPDRTQVLKTTKLPVLFILGQHDKAVPLKDGLEQCHMPQLSYIHILEHSGHMGMVEESAAANLYISRFISGTLNLQKL
jgi:pimeloyl-ACP methyl ester carboxylesterase